MKLHNFTLICLLLMAAKVPAQNTLRLAPNISLSRDSARNEKIIKALGELLPTLDARDDQNPLVDKQYKVQTLDLLDEFRGIRKNEEAHNDTFYSPSVGNIVSRDDSSSLVQIIYAGTASGQSVTRAVFNLLAHIHSSGLVTFCSPIAVNTAHWRQAQIGNFNFHYKDKLNTSKAKEFCKYVKLYDGKIGQASGTTELYCCSNATEVLQLLGISYKDDYAGRKVLVLSASFGDVNVSVNSEGGESFDSFDPHDLWHSRLRRSMSPAVINRPVDEGCAYLYGGSWGINWKTIYRQFMDTYGKDTAANWLDLYGKFQNFGKSESEPLYAAYVINALIIHKLEKEKGFAAVKELLSCGKYEKGNENYFAALNKLLGINKENFNTEVWKLLREHRVS